MRRMTAPTAAPTAPPIMAPVLLFDGDGGDGEAEVEAVVLAKLDEVLASTEEEGVGVTEGVDAPEIITGSVAVAPMPFVTSEGLNWSTV